MNRHVLEQHKQQKTGINPSCRDRFFLLVWCNMLGMVHCIIILRGHRFPCIFFFGIANSVVVVLFVFNIPPTAKVIWGHGLKSHPTDW